MLIACPHCATSYQVAEDSLGTAGRSVRCSRCRTVWFAAPEEVPHAGDAPALTETGTPDEAAFQEELGPAASSSAVHVMTDEPPPTPDDRSADGTEPADGQASENVVATAAPAAQPDEPATDEPAPPVGADDSIFEQPIQPPNDPHPIAAEEAPLAPDDPPYRERIEPEPVEPAAYDTESGHAEPDSAAPVKLSDITIPIENAPPLAPAAPAFASRMAEALDHRRHEKPAAHRKPQSGKPPRPASSARRRLPLIVAALLLLTIAAIVARKPVVRHAPQMASFYAAIGLPVNLRGLAFDNVLIATEAHDGVPVLVVEGVIVNVVSGPVEVPRLRFALRDINGNEIYSWIAAPTQPKLDAGGKLPFRSRLASPPADGRDIQVRFVNRRDTVAGLR